MPIQQMFLSSYGVSSGAPTFAVWSIINKASWITVSGSNHIATGDAAHYSAGLILGDRALPAGKSYMEFSFAPNADGVGVGVSRGSGLTGYLGQPTDGYGHYLPGNDIYSGSLNVRNGTNNAVTPVIIGWAQDGLKVWIWIQGQPTWEGGGNPATGTTPTYTIPTAGTYYPAATPFTGASAVTLNAGHAPFTLWTPTGGFAGF